MTSANEHLRFCRSGLLFIILVGCQFAPAPVVAALVDFVPDEATALAIGKVVLRPLVGSHKIGGTTRDGKPVLTFYANRASSGYNFCYVENAPPARLQWPSPVIRVEIDKSSARIQYASDGVDRQWLVLTSKNESDKAFMPKLEQCKTSGGNTESVWTLHGMGLGNKRTWLDIPPIGFVPNAETAIGIAKAILKPLVGTVSVEGPHALPFYGTLSHEKEPIWRVENAPPLRKKWTSPVLSVQIDKRTGRIIEASDGDKHVWRSRNF